MRGEAPEQKVQCSRGRPGHRVPEMGQNLVSLQLSRLPSCAVMLLNKLLTFLLFLLPWRAVEVSQNPTVSRNLANPLVHAQLPGGVPLSHPRQREMMSSYPIPIFLLKPHGCLRVHCLICHMGKEGHGPVCWGHMSSTQRQLMDALNQHVAWEILTLLHVGAPRSPSPCSSCPSPAPLGYYWLLVPQTSRSTQTSILPVFSLLHYLFHQLSTPLREGGDKGGV